MIKYDEFPFTELEWKMCSFVIQIIQFKSYTRKTTKAINFEWFSIMTSNPQRR